MNILDTTVRDGSYAVDFKFSCDDVKNIVAKSAKIGIEYIEIGHGMGLNASSDKNGISLHTDIEYMIAAREASPTSKLGFFCIPGIARLEDIRLCSSNGMHFIRIGTNVTEYREIKQYVSEAKKVGVHVAVNFMKSYVVSPEKYAEAAMYAEECGADCVYIVDSAGCMTKNDLEKYIDAVRERGSVKIGFHGHNNIGLAVSNSIFCVEKGIDFVDCSYQGLGRSCGNAPLEQFVMGLEKNGHKTYMDIPRVLEYGYSALRNIVNQNRLINPLDYVCGYAGFHSSYLKDIYRCCTEYQVDPLRLIIEYSKVNKVDMDYTELSNVALSLPRDVDINPYSFADYFSGRYIL
ncbi:MAG: hypothetical protein J5802_14750 [Butyrivibrio sp.]|nr:hypothetical protein [Butyrivibrio sp.]